MKPQLLLDCQDPETLFRDSAFVAEEKLDGDRRLIVKRGNAVTGYTRTGNSAPLSETMLALATARNLLSRPPHQKRSDRGQAPGSEGV